MREDKRVRHGEDLRRRAAALFGAGRGYRAVSRELAVPVGTVREWERKYRAAGGEALLDMGGYRAVYTYEQKVAAASAVVDGGVGKRDAMAAFGILSKAPLDKWCRLYREGGEEALRPARRGRPPSSPGEPPTRERELEREVARLGAEVAYLKKLAALRAEEARRTGSRPAR